MSLLRADAHAAADADRDGLAAFATAERAKRRLLFGLLDLGLPVQDDASPSTCSPAASARS